MTTTERIVITEGILFVLFVYFLSKGLSCDALICNANASIIAVLMLIDPIAWSTYDYLISQKNKKDLNNMLDEFTKEKP